MAASRRAFLQLIGLNGAAVAAGAAAAGRRGPWQTSPLAPGPIRLSSNENSYGPGPRVLEIIERERASVNRYAFGIGRSLAGRIAEHLGVSGANVVSGCGSSAILEAAVTAFAGGDRTLVTAHPSFELPSDQARGLGAPVVEVPVSQDLALDLEQMADRSAGASLVYVCNPNNPTGTVHGARAIEEFVERVLRRTPDALILIDEAYHEYVEAPGYRSAVPLAVENPQVLVSRTFSKIYGMAGLRVGYGVGRPETVGRLRRRLGDLDLSSLSVAAALAALDDEARVEEQRRLNREARAATARVFREAGCRVVDSEANFLMADVGRDIRLFQSACRRRGVQIARPFPPLTTWARVTVGTAEEMARAAGVFREALAEPASSAASLPPLGRVPWRDAAGAC